MDLSSPLPPLAVLIERFQMQGEIPFPPIPIDVYPDRFPLAGPEKVNVRCDKAA